MNHKAARQHLHPIGEVARRFGISVRTIHHYEELGLLPPAARDGSNQRCYSEAAIAHIEVVLRLKELGFRLKDITEAYSLCHEETGDLAERYAAKIALLRGRRDWLQERVAELQNLLSGVDQGLARMERARQAVLAASPAEEGTGP